VRTAEGLHKHGFINENAQKRILEALEEAGRVFDFKNLPVRCVTTEALRRASNATAVLQNVHTHTGLTFEIIDGATEAALTASSSAWASIIRIIVLFFWCNSTLNNQPSSV